MLLINDLKLIPLLFTLFTAAACNSGSLKDGQDEKNRGSEDAAQDDSAKEEELVSEQSKNIEDDETRIAKQPAYISGAFLVGKMIGVKDGIVTVGVAFYDSSKQVYDSKPQAMENETRNLVKDALVYDFVWRACKQDNCVDVTSYVAIAGQENLQYSAILQMPYEQYNGASIQTDYNGQAIGEAYEERSFAFKDFQCAGGCEIRCESGTKFYHSHSATDSKYIIDEGKIGIGLYYGVSKPCDDKGYLFLASLKLHMPRCAFKTLKLPWEKQTCGADEGDLISMLNNGTFQANEGDDAQGSLLVDDLAKCSGPAIDRIYEDLAKVSHPSFAKETKIQVIPKDHADLTCISWEHLNPESL